MRLGTLLLTAVVAVSMGAASARACDFDPANAQADVDKAEVVFTGGVTGTQHLSRESNNGTNPEFKTMFSADKFYKGHAGGAVNVIQMHDAWGHYVTFNTGKAYLILAGRNEYGLLIDGCSPIMSLDPKEARSDEPGPEYKKAIMQALKDETIFPSLAPVAEEKTVTHDAKKIAKSEPASGEMKKAMKKAKEDLEDNSPTQDESGDE